MNITALIIGTVLIVLFSWNYSIKHGRYHGIPRFFAFESIYLLVLMNLNLWFSDPFSFHQVISWILLILSAYLGIAGFVTLKKKGKSGRNFENTTVLVKSGIYSLIRHPLYSSLIMLGTGVMMKDLGFLTVVLGVINITACWMTAITEEKEMVTKFGEPYKQYIMETRMFVPFLV